MSAPAHCGVAPLACYINAFLRRDDIFQGTCTLGKGTLRHRQEGSFLYRITNKATSMRFLFYVSYRAEKLLISKRKKFIANLLLCQFLPHLLDSAVVGNVSKGNISLSNSLNLGLSLKVGEGQISGNVDFYKVEKAVQGYMEAGVEYIKGQFSDIFPWSK